MRNKMDWLVWWYGVWYVFGHDTYYSMALIGRIYIKQIVSDGDSSMRAHCRKIEIGGKLKK